MPNPNYRKVEITFDHELDQTRQEFHNECEINRIMAKYQKTGLVSHVNTHGLHYGDYDAIDFQTAMDTIKAGEAMFADLPSRAREYFNNDPASFMDFVNDPENADKLIELGLATREPRPIDNHTPAEPSEPAEPIT